MELIPSVLVVDDDPGIRETLSDILEAKGYTVSAVPTGKECIDRARVEFINVALVDLRLPDMSGTEVLQHLKEFSPDTEVVMITGHASLTSAVEALNSGAFGYVPKPLELEQVLAMMHKALERQHLTRDLRKAYQEIKQRANELELLATTSLIVSSSPSLEQVLQALAEHMVRQLQVTLCRICLLDKEGKTMTVRAAFPVRNIPWEPGIGQGFEIARIPCVRRIVELQGTEVFRQDANDSDLSKVERDLVLPEEAHSSLLMAMVAKGHTLGFVTLVEARAWERSPFTDQKINLCRAITSQAAMSVENAILFEDRARTHSATLTALAAALDAREHETHAHCWRVREYALTLGRQMGISEPILEDIATGALLHDVGKIGVSDRILLKPEGLTEEEWVEMRKHPAIGYDILKGIKPLAAAREIVYSHHERYDGKGYPRGLAGDAIPVGARIFAVADTFDAITSDRPYRKKRGYEVARAEIVRCDGTQFDPKVVEAFLKVAEEEWERIKAAAEQAPYWLWLS